MEKQQQIFTPLVIIQLVIFVILVPFLPLIISGQWDWWQGWVFALVYIASFVISRGMAARRHPDLLAERARFMDHEDAKSWDKYLAPLVGLGGGLISLVVGLDGRFDWSSEFSTPVNILALLVLLFGYAWGSYALVENRFFSGMVRIQTERNHHVVSTGPYKWMRHPGYVGAILAYLATPFFLDSIWALIPAVLLVIALVVRTYLEDTTLQDELGGYRNYANKVRYRLIPGIW